MKAAFLSLFLVLQSLPAAAQETGDIFISVAGGRSGRIHLDGLDTGNEAPATLRDVEEGAHKVEVFGQCVKGWQTVEVVPGRVTRTELILQPGSGFMELTVTPDSAEFLLDGAPIGTGPILATELSCGPHIIQFEAIGFLTETRAVEVKIGSVHRLKVNLQAVGGKGTISALVEPVHAELYLDEVLVATGPITLDDMDAGTHQLVVLADGYTRHNQEVTIVANEVTKLDIRLEKDGLSPQKVEPQTTPDTSAPRLTQPPDQVLPPAASLPTPQNNTLRRISAAYGLCIAGGGMGIYGYRFWQNALAHYENYETLTSNENPNAENYYKENVIPAYRRSIGLAVGGGVAVISGLSLGLNSLTTPVVGISGTW